MEVAVVWSPSLHGFGMRFLSSSGSFLPHLQGSLRRTEHSGLLQRFWVRAKDHVVTLVKGKVGVDISDKTRLAELNNNTLQCGIGQAVDVLHASVARA